MKDYQKLWENLKKAKKERLDELEVQHKINHPEYQQLKQSIREMENLENTL